MSTSLGKVSSLSIYPVKSMRGIDLESSKITNLGLEFDRRYLVVDMENVFITQRNLPRLATIRALIDESGMTLRSEGKGQISVQNESFATNCKVTIWKDHIEAQDMGDDASMWLTQALATPCRLVKLTAQSKRQIDPDFANSGEFVSFADGFPILIANQSSLEDLNRRMGNPLPMNRFRPNIVVEGFKAWDEDSWTIVQIGDVSFRVAKPCARCRVTTQDQMTGMKHGEEPLVTLAKFRNFEKKVIFGQNLIPNGEGEIRIGDPLRVVSK